MTTEPTETFCKVKYCRFPNTHTTSAHQCGKCKGFGHGQTECDHDNRKTRLVNFHNENLPTQYWCLLCPSDSEFRKTHTSSSHVCRHCGERTVSHQEEDCIIQDLEVYTQRFMGMQDIDTFETHLFEQYGHNIYTILNIGMGCCIYVRRKNGVIKALFMHSDCWGQYGPASDDRPKLNKFIDGCIEYDTLLFQPSLHPLPDSPVNIVQCPICRTENSFDSIKIVFGCEENCKICMEKNVTKFFSECGHLVSCDECFESLSKN
tara:strand:- start:383 stop:1168 length:786 start_codon:yes stop_codon:yes gene_type:complete